jgi:Flp pilus assembly protein TadD
MDNYERYMKEAARLVDEGDVDKAAREYSRAIEEYPERPGAYYNLALLYNCMGKVDDAIANFRDAAERNPGDASIHNNLAVLYYSKGSLAESEVSFKKAIELEPDYADALFGLSHVYLKSAEADAAEKLGEHVKMIKKRIEILHQQSRIQDAREITGKLMKLSPDDAETCNDYAVLCYESGKANDARETINRARELTPGNPDIQENHRMIHSDGWEDWQGQISL